MLSDLQLLGMAKLLQTDFGALLNRAQREEVEAWPWSFLLTNYVLYSALQQSAGTVTLTPGSSTVVGAGTSFSLPQNTRSFLHVGTSNVALPILSSSDGQHLVLGDNAAQAYNGAAISGSAYNIITPVYSVAGFIEVYQVKQILPLEKVSRESLNERDPARLATGGNPSVAWAPAGFDASGNIQIELWESPSSQAPYVIEGKLGAATMANNSDQPQLPSAVLEAKALSMACDAMYLSSGDEKYFQLGQKYQGAYQEELDKAKTADSQRQNQRKMQAGSIRFGLDVIASHDMGLR